MSCADTLHVAAASGRLLWIILLLSATDALAGAASAPTPAPLEPHAFAFEPNRGQVDTRASYVARGNDAVVYITDAGAVLALQAPAESKAPDSRELRRSPPFAKTKAPAPPVPSVALRYGIAHAKRHPVIEGLDPLPGRSNYLIGNDRNSWHIDIPQYRRVRYRDVLPGVNVVYYGKDGQLEFDVEVAAGVSLANLRLRVDGADGLALDGEGNLRVRTALGEIVQRKPVVYQMLAGERREVAAGYLLPGDGTAREVAFVVADYDRRAALVLDPALVFSQLFGGSGDDKGAAIATDADGYIYLGGYTNSANFPTTVGAYQTATPTGYDAFVRKLSADGSTVVYSTLLGGSNGSDYLQAIAVDGNGIAHVSGLTDATNFPVKNALQGSNPGGMFNLSVGFVSALNAAGSDLVYSTYFGGDNPTNGLAVAVDAAGYAYVSGYTYATNLPVSPGAFQGTLGGGDDAFVAKFSPAGARVYATYLGGTGYDSGNAIAIDDLGAAYVVGFASSATLHGVTPATIGPLGGVQEILLAVVNPAGDGLVYATLIGGNGDDEGNAVAVDGGHQVYLAALSNSTNLAPTPPMTGASYGAWTGHIDDSGTQLIESAWYAGSDGGNAFSAGIDLDEARKSLIAVGRSDKPGGLPAVNPVIGLDCAAACTAATGGFLARYTLKPLTLSSATRVTGGSATNTLLSAAAHDTGNGEVVAIGASDGSPPLLGSALAANSPKAVAADADGVVVYRASFGPPPPKLAPTLDKYFAPATIREGASGTLTFVVTNLNKALTLTGIGISDTFPACVAPLSTLAAVPASCLHRVDQAVYGSQVPEFFAADELAPEERCTYTIAVQALAGGACVNQTDPVLSNQANGTAASAVLNVLPVPGKTWSGPGSNMNDASNYEEVALPVAGSDVTFPALAMQLEVNTNLAVLFNLFRVSGNGYVFSGSTVNLSAGIYNTGANTVISAPVTAQEPIVIASLGNGMTLSGGLNLNGFSADFEGSGAITVQSTISGTGAVTSRAGTFTIGSAPTYTGSFGLWNGTAYIKAPMTQAIDVYGGMLRGNAALGNVTVHAGGSIHPGIDATPATLPANNIVIQYGEAEFGFSANNGTHDSITVSGSMAIVGLLKADFGIAPAVNTTYHNMITVSGAGTISGCFQDADASPANVVIEAQCTPSEVSIVVRAIDRLFEDGFGYP